MPTRASNKVKTLKSMFLRTRKQPVIIQIATKRWCRMKNTIHMYIYTRTGFTYI